MILDVDKFRTDESKSNPMQVAQQYPGCPIDSICFHVVVGFGSVVEICPHLNADQDPAECTYGVTKEEDLGKV